LEKRLLDILSFHQFSAVFTSRRAAEKRDELAPSNVTCHASLPRRHAQSKQYYIVIRSFASVARWSRYVRRPISRVVEKVPSALYADVTPLKLNPQRR